MKFRLFLILGLAAALLGAVLLAGPASSTDLTITFNVIRMEPGDPGGARTEIHYISEAYRLTRGVESRQDQLVDFQKGMTYTIDHKEKTISKLSFDDLMAAMEAVNQSLSQNPGQSMAPLLGDPSDCKVERLGSEDVIGRHCQIWRISVGKVTMDLSVDPSLRAPGPEEVYPGMVMKSRAAQMAKAGPMGAFYQRLYEEMGKVQGIALKTHLTGPMNVNVATEATHIEVGPIPASTFALPEGYQVEDLGERIRKVLGN
jgi:hypothetical protein